LKSPIYEPNNFLLRDGSFSRNRIVNVDCCSAKRFNKFRSELFGADLSASGVQLVSKLLLGFFNHGSCLLASTRLLASSGLFLGFFDLGPCVLASSSLLIRFCDLGLLSVSSSSLLVGFFYSIVWKFVRALTTNAACRHIS